jgi:hypothetical protein
MAAGQNYGTNTSSLMDKPLALKSVVTPVLGDNGYKFDGAGGIQVINTQNGTAVTYNETATTGATPVLVNNDTETLTLSYNKAIFARIQQTLIQDTPVANFVAQWAKQQIEQVFVPGYDVYALNKIVVGRATANDVTVTVTSGALPTSGLSKLFGKAFINIRANGADASNTVAWVADSFANELADQVAFTGSDAGYNGAIAAAFLGKLKGVICIATPDAYFTAVSTKPVYVIMADKRALVNVSPKMNPSNYVVIPHVSGFSGPEVQIRHRADLFVLDKKTGNISIILSA